MYIMFNRVSKIPVLALLVLILSATSLKAQSGILWSQTYGGEQDETFQNIVETDDLGAQVIGFGQSNVGTIKSGQGLYDIIICEMAENGDLNWTSSIGGSAHDLGKSILLDNEKTFIGGLTYSNDLDGNIHLGAGDILFGDLNEDHQLSQSKFLGGNKLDNIVAIALQKDGSLIIVANTNSTDVAQIGIGGATDIYICNLTKDGTLIWENTIGSSGVDKATDFAINKKGEIIITGFTFSDNFLEFRKGIKDGFVLCLNDKGEQQWGRRFTNGNYSNFVAIDLDRIDNILLAGVQGKINDTNSGINGVYNEDVWALKLASNGSEIWRNQFGGSANDFATDIVASHDGGMLIVGHTVSYDGIVRTNYGNKDAFATKLNADGVQEWSQNYGGSKDDQILAVTQDRQGHYWLTGQTASDDIDLNENNGGSDAWILKLEGEEPTLQLIVASSFEVCSGESLDIDVEIPFCECEYRWSDGFVGAQRTATYDDNTSLTITVTDENNNQASGEIEIIVHPKPEFELTATHLSCIDNIDGEISAEVLEGTAPFEFEWSNGETADVLTGLEAGLYTLTVTDANGCSALLDAEIDAPQTFQVTATIESAVCNANSGNISLILEGGNAPFEFEWSNGTTTESNENLLPGEYIVNVIDANGCSIEETFIVENDDFDFDLEFEILDNLCHEGSQGSISILNMEGLEDLNWSTGATSANLNDLSAGEYTLEYTTIEGCSGTQTFIISEPRLLEVTPIATDNACSGNNSGSIGLELRGGTPPYDFNWSTGATSPFITELAAGEYLVTITDSNACQIEESIAIENGDFEFELQFEITNNLCYQGAGGSISILNGSELDQLIWNTGDEGASLNSLAAGEYTLEYTTLDGCSATQSFEISEPTVFEATANSNNNICAGENNGFIELEIRGGIPPYKFEWSNGADTPFITSLAEGEYSVTLTDVNDCSFILSTQIESPTALEIVDTNLSNETCREARDGTISFDIEGGTGTYMYEWSNGSNASSLDNLSEGTYSVTITDENGCTIIGEAEIEEADEFPIVNSELIDPTCYGETNGFIILSPGNINNVLSYLWPDNFTGNQRNDLAAGDYEVTVSTSSGCEKVLELTLDSPLEIQIDLETINISCFDEQDASIDVSVSGGKTPYVIELNGPNSFTNSILNNQSVGNLSAGEYTINTVDANGCIQENTIIINEPQAIIIQGVVSDASCFGETDGAIETIVSGGTGEYDYFWGGELFDNFIEEVPAGIYLVEVNDENGCFQERTFQINQPDRIFVENSIVHPSSDLDDDGSIELIITGGTAPYEVVWNNGDEGMIINDLGRGLYQFTCTDANGCQFTDNILLESTTSTSQLRPFEALNIYPNPADNLLYISMEGNHQDVQLRLINALGQIIYQEQTSLWNSNLKSIDVSQIPTGLYHLYLANQKNQSSYKVVISHN